MSISENDVANYSNLKQLVHQLKHEHQEALENQKSARKADSYALAEQKQQYDEIISDLNKRHSDLSAQNRQNVERFAKVRQALERDKQKLQLQVENLTKINTELVSKHQKELAEHAGRHANELKQLTESHAQALQLKEEEIQNFKQQHQQKEMEIQNWCQSEIQSVQQALTAQVNNFNAQYSAWQRNLLDEKRRREDVEAKLQAAVEKEKKLLEDLESTKSAMETQEAVLVDEADAAASAHAIVVRELEVALEDAKKKGAEEVRLQKMKHTQQLSMIEAKLQATLTAKDTTNAKLRTELEVVTNKLKEFESLLQQEI
uniref:Uncharacterized protein n=1 Tax=Polytomella parva TaxID=51329 RepID=A0A7S0YJ13_9CHLO|mmetsp:Transcript_29018/g.53326  ORF Transcript_29018/g.53326 Transcript_29018/m.53326 type:complete len:317 (+) Transcript_29018:70-1020(+)